jgi:hypothetical protein
VNGFYLADRGLQGLHIGIRVMKWGTLEDLGYVSNPYSQETEDKSVIFQDNNATVCPEIFTEGARPAWKSHVRKMKM